MAAQSNLILLHLIALTTAVLLLLTLSSAAIPSTSITKAYDTLSDSGYLAMSLTIEFVSEELFARDSPLQTATIFAPPDSAFSDSGQPSLALLQYHVLPFAISLEGLRSFPFGTSVSTLSSNHPLIVTTTSSSSPAADVSLNNVTVGGSPVYDDGVLIVYGVDNFFDLNFKLAMANLTHNPSFDVTCSVSATGAVSFANASKAMRSQKYSAMASFLDLQMVGYLGQPKLTLFAPDDVVMSRDAGNFSEYPSLFLRHVVPCKLERSDLLSLRNETVLRTHSEGFSITVSSGRSGGGEPDDLMLNGVTMRVDDLYHSDWFVVYGIHQILIPMVVVPETTAKGGGHPESSSASSLRAFPL